MPLSIGETEKRYSMELLSLYETIGVLILVSGKVSPTDRNYGNALLLSALFTVAVVLVFFILQGVALYCMAKKRGIGRRWMAFVPFANVMLIGRLAGEVTFFGQRIKRAGLYAMIVRMIVAAIVCSYVIVEIYLNKQGCIGYEPVDGVLEEYRRYFANGTRFERNLFRYYNDAANLIYMIFGLIGEVLMLVLLCALFKQYAPERYMLLTVLTVFIPLSRYVITFVLRNRRAVNYQAYMRAKRESYMRRQQQYYGQGGYNPYGGAPHGGTPYGGQTPPQNKPEEPFSEFSSDKKADDPFSEFSSDKKSKTGGKDENSDDFFH